MNREPNPSTQTPVGSDRHKPEAGEGGVEGVWEDFKSAIPSVNGVMR